MTEGRFRELLERLSDGWARRDYAKVIEEYAPDVRYGDPLRYRFTDRAALRAFFEADQGLEQRTVWHNVIFDEARQIAAVEYTYDGSHRYHGVAIVRLAGDRITHWREFQHIDSRDYADFVGATAFPEGAGPKL
jgi:SnoaL-like domain